MRNVKPTTIRFTDADKALIERLKRRYGVTSVVEVVRLALRLADERSVDRSVDRSVEGGGTRVHDA